MKLLRFAMMDSDGNLRDFAGCCMVNDVSARDFQIKRHGQWVKGKSADTFGPTDPWPVTRDEVPGDVIELGIAGLGVQRQRTVAAV